MARWIMLREVAGRVSYYPAVAGQAAVEHEPAETSLDDPYGYGADGSRSCFVSFFPPG
jgi:hypothetical protein